MPRRPLLLLLSCLIAACSGPDPREDRARIASGIAERTGFEIGEERTVRDPTLPDGVSLDDGLSEDEAVMLALWNNAAFQETLAQLGLSRADLIEAGLLSNPVLSLLFPLGPKQLEFAVTFPLEAIWLRPRRVAIAEIEHRRVGDRLVEAGLDLVRDARIAYADLRLARRQASLAEEASRLRRRIADVAETRLRAGAVSELEVSAARVDAMRARQEETRRRRDVTLADVRLKMLLGVSAEQRELVPEDTREPTPSDMEPDPVVYIERAYAARPDLRAAELDIKRRSKEAGLSRWEFLALSVILDANSEGVEGFEIGPGIELEIPLFDWNQGGMARADARLQLALRHYVTVRDRIELAVRASHARFRMAREDLRLSRTEMLPALELTVRLAERAYGEGNASYLLVLETTRLLIEERGREADLRADVRRARADLERSVGQRLDLPIASNPITQDQSP